MGLAVEVVVIDSDVDIDGRLIVGPEVGVGVDVGTAVPVDVAVAVGIDKDMDVDIEVDVTVGLRVDGSVSDTVLVLEADDVWAAIPKGLTSSALAKQLCSPAAVTRSTPRPHSADAPGAATEPHWFGHSRMPTSLRRVNSYRLCLCAAASY